MIRLLVTVVVVCACVIAVGFVLYQTGVALRELLAPKGSRSGAQSRRLGYGYLFVCWLICSAFVTALIWEYWY